MPVRPPLAHALAATLLLVLAGPSNDAPDHAAGPLLQYPVRLRGQTCGAPLSSNANSVGGLKFPMEHPDAIYGIHDECLHFALALVLNLLIVLLVIIIVFLYCDEPIRFHLKKKKKKVKWKKWRKWWRIALLREFGCWRAILHSPPNF